MRYDDEAYLELFPRAKAQPQVVKVESACETFRPSENNTQLNNDLAVQPVAEEPHEEVVTDGNDGTDSTAD